jgi:ABC-type polysaccharide/polyol phosphate transport system ATPase subunit
VPATAVEFSRVSKSYSIYAAPGDRLKELMTFNQRRFHTDYWALRDVSFEAHFCKSALVYWNRPRELLP